MPDDERSTTTSNGETAPTPVEAPRPDDWATRYKYLLADFENFRRRSERDRETITRQARGAMLRELLPILEGFRSAQPEVAKLPAADPVRRGLELLEREWATFLRHEGVEPVAEVGRPFRADECEAIGDAPASDGTPAGTVAEIVQQGYRFFGGLLRPAKVVVARDPAPAATEAAASDLPSPEGSA